MKLMIEVDVTKAERKMLTQNSLERVLNTALNIHENLDAFNRDQNGAMNIEDLEALSPLASRIWYAASGAAMMKEV